MKEIPCSIESIPFVGSSDSSVRKASDSRSQGCMFDFHPGCGVVSMSKTLQPQYLIVLVEPNFSSAELSDDCVSKFTSLVRARD